MIFSKNSGKNKENSLISEREWDEVLSYLISHADSRPFQLDDVASAVHISIEQVVAIFSMMRASFNLFHILQSDKLLKQDDIFSYSHPSNKLVVIEISDEDMDTYASFVYLYKKLNTSPDKLKSDITFRSLIEKYPQLFEIHNNNWKPTKIGEYFVLQYQKFKKLKSPCPQLEYKNVKLTLLN